MINVKKIFNCLSGNNELTEEFIYNNFNKNEEEYTVLSSSTKKETRMGLIPICKNKKGLDINVFKDKPGILVARNGKAGKMTYLKQGNYTINDHAYILSLKENFCKEFNFNTKDDKELFLKFFIYRYQYEVYNYSTKNDNATWNKTGFFKYCNIEIPDKTTMKKIVKRYKKCEFLKEKVDFLEAKLNELLSKNISINENKSLKKVQLNNILSYISRNDALSEEGIYNFYPKESKTIDVLSGSINNIYYGKIDYDTPKIHKLDNRQGIHIVTRGKAGKLTYVKKGTYATNTNAFLLYIDKERWKELNIKNEKEEEIYLKFLIIYLQPIFYEVSSNSDVSVFPLTNMMKKFVIPRFVYNEEIKKNVELYYKSIKFKETLTKSREILDSLFDKQILLD
ncbi:hypothetical protein P5F04_12990 [Clostridium perfringens]|nr:hypothetical protein [Clostridium perfringens]MDK0665653.1 hypothetical protein [Clostridium perfringens]